MIIGWPGALRLVISSNTGTDAKKSNIENTTSTTAQKSFVRPQTHHSISASVSELPGALDENMDSNFTYCSQTQVDSVEFEDSCGSDADRAKSGSIAPLEADFVLDSSSAGPPPAAAAMKEAARTKSSCMAVAGWSPSCSLRGVA
mmetsp:Transcript_69480/g.122885  ORF Transcript_69480/g.122885 Transcript_69480/m.122885 type:complete len:145 (-) Transcript_69480:13-447(-)